MFLLQLERSERVLGVHVFDDVGEGAVAVAVLPAAADLFQVHEGDAADLVHELVELVDLEAQGVGHLLVAGGAAEALLDLAVGALEAPALLPHAARDPVQGAELVEDRALDPELRVGLELAVLVGVVLVDGVDQADDAGVVKVIEVDV